MSALLLPIGVLILTFWVSRAFLTVLRRTTLTPTQRLLIGHAGSLALIALFVFWVRVFDVIAPFIYLPGQLFWFGLDWLRENQVGKAASRSRRRGTARTMQSIKIPEWFLLVGMGVLAVAYVGYAWNRFSWEAISYGDVYVYAPPPDVVYAAGKPTMARKDDTQPWQPVSDPRHSAQWLYTTPFMIFNFNRDQLVNNIVCSNQDKVSQGACTPTLRIDIGEHENSVMARLGSPTNLIITEDGKHIFSYPEIGHDFVFEQFYVRSLRVYPSNGNTLGWYWRFIIWMLP